jgi:large subunit ribosomal protein L6
MSDDTKMARSMWGMSRTMVSNLVKGVTDGYSQTLEIQGVGFRAAMKGKDLSLNIGFSHDVIHKIPAGIEVKVAGAKSEIITVSGIDRQLVGQVAANIRASRPPEPYQGKGIRYQGEYIFRKEGKKK